MQKYAFKQALLAKYADYIGPGGRVIRSNTISDGSVVDDRSSAGKKVQTENYFGSYNAPANSTYIPEAGLYQLKDFTPAPTNVTAKIQEHFDRDGISDLTGQKMTAEQKWQKDKETWANNYRINKAHRDEVAQTLQNYQPQTEADLSRVAQAVGQDYHNQVISPYARPLALPAENAAFAQQAAWDQADKRTLAMRQEMAKTRQPSAPQPPPQQNIPRAQLVRRAPEPPPQQVTTQAAQAPRFPRFEVPGAGRRLQPNLSLNTPNNTAFRGRLSSKA